MSVPWDAIAAAGTIGLAVGVPMTIYYELKNANKTMRQERYLQYVERYQQIITNLPYNIFMKGNQVNDVGDKKVWLLAYIDLCAEELFDHNKGLIEDDVWKDWSGFIIENFKRAVPLQNSSPR